MSTAAGPIDGGTWVAGPAKCGRTSSKLLSTADLGLVDKKRAGGHDSDQCSQLNGALLLASILALVLWLVIARSHGLLLWQSRDSARGC